MSLFVGNLSLDVTEEDLSRAFGAFGAVGVRLVKDRSSGRSKGFAFVDMADRTAAQAAIDSLKGTELKGRTLDVAEAQPRLGGGRGGALGRGHRQRPGRGRPGRRRR